METCQHCKRNDCPNNCPSPSEGYSLMMIACALNRIERVLNSLSTEELEKAAKHWLTMSR